MPQSAMVRQTRWTNWRTPFSRSARAHLAVEILVGHHVRGQLAPGGGDFAVELLEEHLAPFALDGGGAGLPLDGGKRVGPVIWAKQSGYGKSFRRGLGGLGVG